ncbi:MAG TPA: sugar ABC transporter permease [Cellulomonas sp.]
MNWLFLVPVIAFYGTFVLRPLASTLQYSFYDWNGIDAASWVGLDNYATVMTDPQLRSSIVHAFILILFFSFLPVLTGLVTAVLVRDIRSRVFGPIARTVLFLPQVIPGAAAATAWVWMYSDSGAVNQILRALGLDSWARSWLGEQSSALPAVGIIGFWLATGLCTVLLQAGIGKIDVSLYEAVRLDGAGWFRELWTITLPGLRQEIGVALTITIISALASFDVVFMSTQGGPGYSTMVPGVEIYRLAFTQSRVGLASALAIVLLLLVLAIVGPLQRAFQEKR